MRGDAVNSKIQQIADIDRMLHEPARLVIVAVLSRVREADFQFLLQATGLTKGNLSAHLSKLEEAGYVSIEKTYRVKVPMTICALTEQGQTMLAKYRKTIKAAL